MGRDVPSGSTSDVSGGVCVSGPIRRVQQQLTVGPDLEPRRALGADHDPAEVRPRRDEQVVLEPFGVFAHADIDAVVHPAVDHTAIGGHAGLPPRRIVADEVVVDPGPLSLAHNRRVVRRALEDERQRRRRALPELQPDGVRFERSRDGPLARREPRGCRPLAAVFDEIDRQPSEDCGFSGGVMARVGAWMLRRTAKVGHRANDAYAHHQCANTRFALKPIERSPLSGSSGCRRGRKPVRHQARKSPL